MMSMRFASQAPVDAVEVQRAWRSWVLQNGFRDLAETVGAMLEVVQQILCIWDLKETVDDGHRIPVEAWNEHFPQRHGRFHAMGLPAKLDFLAKNYQFRVAENFQAYVRSINAVRNCLVHRQGLAGEKDVDENGELTLSWEALVLLDSGPEGTREVAKGDMIPGGHKISMAPRSYSRTFMLGDAIDFEAVEFAGIAWTIHRLGRVVASDLIRYGQERGIVFESAHAEEE